MMQPTLYQQIIISQYGYDPWYWWPVQWEEGFCVLRNRATNETITLEGIEGYGPPGNCRNLAEE